MKTAVVNSSSFGRYFPEHLEALNAIGTVTFFSFASDEHEDVLIDALRDYDYIISSVTPNFTEKFFEQCDKLRIISRHGIGFNNIDVAAANKHQVYVTKVPASIEKDAVAENAIALLSSLSRHVVHAAQAAKDGEWVRRAEFMGYQLQGKTAGIIGFGNIGSRVATILKDGFNMRVLAYDPLITVNVRNKINDIEFVSLETMAALSDFISLNAFLDNESQHMVDEALLCRMQKHTMIVNTARGALVDDHAIVKAVAEGRIAGYAADVVEDEPILQTHHLLTHPNILVTPHTSAYTWECLRGMGDKCVDDVLRVSRGETPHEQVTDL